MKNSGYIVVEKSKDHVSKDYIDKTYNNIGWLIIMRKTVLSTLTPKRVEHIKCKIAKKK